MTQAEEAIEIGRAGVPPLLLRQIDLSECGVSALNLLLGALPDRVNEAGRQGVRLFALVDVADAGLPCPAAAALTVDEDAETVEVRMFAVSPGFPRGSTTRRLMSGLADRLRAAGAKRLTVAIPSERRGRERLQAAGFREVPASAGWMEIAL